LLDFLSWHRIDPDSALPGFQPSVQYQRTYMAHVSQYSQGNGESSSDEIEAEFTRDGLLDLILRWSELEDLDKIGKQVIKYANLIRMRTIQRLKKGDMLMVGIPIVAPESSDAATAANAGASTTDSSSSSSSSSPSAPSTPPATSDTSSESTSGGGSDTPTTPSSETSSTQPTSGARPLRDSDLDLRNMRVVYARFVEHLGDKSIIVFASAGENRTEVVDIARAVPLTPEMHLLLGSAAKMAKLVTDSISVLTNHLKDEVRILILDYLQEEGIDIEVLDRCVDNKMTLRDLLNLREIHTKLTKMYANSEPLLQKVEAYAATSISDFRKAMEEHEVFLPTRDLRLDELESWPFCALAKNRLMRYIGLCEGSIDQLLIEKRAYMNGSYKINLGDWWLKLIQKRVRAKLENIGYVFDAIPPDYINKPPRDMETIQRNLALLKDCLSPSADPHGIQDLVKELNDQIYPRIDEFLELSTCVLVDQDQFPHGQHVATFDNRYVFFNLALLSSLPLSLSLCD